MWIKNSIMSMRHKLCLPVQTLSNSNVKYLFISNNSSHMQNCWGLHSWWRCFKEAEYYWVVAMVSSSSVISLHNPLLKWDPCEFPRRLSVVTRMWPVWPPTTQQAINAPHLEQMEIDLFPLPVSAPSCHS